MEKNVWKEMLEMIPMMQNAVQNGLDSHMQMVHKKKKNDKEKLLREYEMVGDRVWKEIESLKSAFEIFRGKYTLEIIFVLSGMKDPYFNQIKKALRGINSGTLSNRLKKLEDMNLIDRHVHDGQPIRVSYSLTERGWGTFKLLMPMLVYYQNYDEFNSLQAFRKRRQNPT